MNRISRILFVSALILMAGLSFGFAKDFELSQFKVSNSRGGETFSVGYSESHEAFYILESSPYDGDTTLYLDEIMMEQLRANIQKALDWNKLAKENKTSVDKDLPDSMIRCHMTALNTQFGQSFSVSGFTYLLFHHKCDANGNFEFKIYAHDIDYSGGKSQSYPSFPVRTMKFKNGLLEDFLKALDKETLQNSMKKQLHPEMGKSSSSDGDIFK